MMSDQVPIQPTDTPHTQGELLSSILSAALPYMSVEGRARLGQRIMDEVVFSDEASQVCIQAYQVVGSMLSDLGQFETEHARKILDNLNQARLVHDDVLPWPSFEQKTMEAPGGTRTLRALEDLAAWHATQALGWKRAAAFDAAENIEPARSSLERLSAWHDAQAKLLKDCAIEPVGEIKLCPPGLVVGAPTPLPVWKDGRMPPVGTKLYARNEAER